MMNLRPAWTLGELANATGLAKSSVFRLLHTLEEEGCVRSPAGSPGVYRLTGSVRDLSSGLTTDSVLADLAAPIVIAGTKRLRWPLSLAVLDDCYMRVICCGMPYSRLAAKTTTLNRRYGMLTSALGLAYFPFCHPTEQQVIVERATGALQQHGSSFPFSSAQLGAFIREVRTQGHSVRWGAAGDATSSIGVPVKAGGELIGSLACSTYARSLTEARVAELVPQIRRVAADIGLAWADQ
jgi:IclR family mhp operon transcriptional activator